MPSPTRSLKNFAKSQLHVGFVWGQKLGVNVLPKHFYSQVPDIARLSRERHWRQPRPMLGVQGAEIEGQVHFLNQVATPVVMEALAGRDIHAEAIKANRSDEGYGPIEANFLYALVRTLKPKRIVQIGAGVSTGVVQLAAADEGYSPEITCIDPYPTPLLVELDQAKKIRLIAEPAQEVDIGVFTALGEGDVFFVDSTHTVTPGGEVNRIVLEILPQLAPGVIVHFHDITFPYDYNRGTLTEDLFFQNESILLHAFLACNPKYRIEACLSMLHYAAPEALAARFPNYRPQGNSDGLRSGTGDHFPSSLWMRSVS